MLYFDFSSSQTILWVVLPFLFSPIILCVIFPSLFLSYCSLCYWSLSLPLQPFSVLYFHFYLSQTILCVIFSSLFLSYLPYYLCYISIPFPLKPSSGLYFHFSSLQPFSVFYSVFWIRIRMDQGFFANPDLGFKSPDLHPFINKLLGSK